MYPRCATSSSKQLLRRSYPCYGVGSKKFSTNNQPNGVKKVTQDGKVYTIGNYISDQVKRYDYENYLVALLFPKISRESYLAVRAFNVEIANIREIAKDPTLAKLRIQWWREIVKDLYKGIIPENPVAKGLHDAISTSKLSRSWFLRILERREKDIDMTAFRTIEEMETYAEETSSALLYLALECLGVKNINADHAVSHIGKATGISILLRATAHHASKRRCYLPLDVMSKHGVSQEELYRGSHSKGLEEVVYETASSAKLHLDQARSFKQDIPNHAIPALISSNIPEYYLTRLQQHHFNVFDPNVPKINFSFYGKLYWNSWTKNY